MHTIDLITRKFARSDSGVRLLLAFFFSCTVSLQPVQAQSPDSTFSERSEERSSPIAKSSTILPELTIRDIRFERTGYSFWKADSLPQSGIFSLSDRLFWENTLDVRANAPGTLATISIRGTGPNRTPIFWNGLNLQSPMNGVMDAALLPIWPDDQVEIHFGGQSAAQSSGALGGSVVVEQGQQNFENGSSGFATGAAGSFGRLDGGAGVGISGKKITSNVRVAWQQADNDFSIQKQGLDGRFYSSKQVNNFINKTDLQQFNALKINDKNTLKTAFWLQSAFRELPPATTESPRQTWQHDRAYRAIASWEHAPDNRTLWTTRAAWIDDYLAFHLAGDTDTSRSRQALFRTERSASIGKQWSWRAGGTALRQWAKVDGYSDSTHWFGQTRLAGYAMGEWRQGGTRFSALLRQEWAESQAAPFTWSLGGQTGLGRVGEMKFHLSRNFNLPTLNDRFWKSLGNPDLHPEKGYSTDLRWAFRRPGYTVEMTGFQLLMDDWILWQPDSSGLFRPDNLRKVWSRGAEVSGKWQMTGNKLRNGAWKTELSGRFQWSKTTNVAVYGGSESVLGRQLPFTPRLSGGLSLRLSRGIFSAAFLQQFTGIRLDNGGKKINAFSVGNVLASCALLKRRLSLDFRLENLWNTQYEIIRYRPMPGRAWRLGVGYKW
ncbi:MAG: TonB-dependent receptor [Saprospiraceae bacterium]|nr:TonB-dependent receptor [Saprospiraceae bacterium]